MLERIYRFLDELGEVGVLTGASARELVGGGWRAAGDAHGLASGIVQLATGADDDVGSDSGNCDTAAQHCKFFFNKVTTTGATWSIVGDFYAILARYEA
jgi:hypothetical protein